MVLLDMERHESENRRGQEMNVKLPTIKELEKERKDNLKRIGAPNATVFVDIDEIYNVLSAHEAHAKEMLDMWESKRAETGKYEKFRQKEIGYWCGRLEAIRALKSQSPLYDTSLYSKKDKPAEITVEKGTPQVSKSRKGEVKE